MDLMLQTGINLGVSFVMNHDLDKGFASSTFNLLKWQLLSA